MKIIPNDFGERRAPTGVATGVATGGATGGGPGRVPVVVAGIIPPEDTQALRQAGAAAIYTPKDYDLNAIRDEIVARGGGGVRRR